MLLHPVFHQINAGFNVLAEPSGVIHTEAPLHQSLHGLLVVVGGILGAGAGELVLGPAPEAFDGHEV